MSLEPPGDLGDYRRDDAEEDEQACEAQDEEVPAREYGRYDPEDQHAQPPEGGSHRDRLAVCRYTLHDSREPQKVVQKRETAAIE